MQTIWKLIREYNIFCLNVSLCLYLGFAEKLLTICIVLICNSSIMGHMNIVLLWILNVLIYSQKKKQQHVKILCHVRYFLYNRGKWGCGFSLQVKCPIILGKGGRIVEKVTLHLKTWN